MITMALVRFALAAFRTLVDTLPAWTADTSALGTSALGIGTMAGVVNGYFPILLLGGCLALLLGLMVVLAAWRLGLFIYHQFWGSN